MQSSLSTQMLLFGAAENILQSQGKKRNKETNIYTGYIFISNVQSDYIYQKLFK